MNNLYNPNILNNLHQYNNQNQLAMNLHNNNNPHNQNFNQNYFTVSQNQNSNLNNLLQQNQIINLNKINQINQNSNNLNILQQNQLINLNKINQINQNNQNNQMNFPTNFITLNNSSCINAPYNLPLPNLNQMNNLNGKFNSAYTITKKPEDDIQYNNNNFEKDFLAKKRKSEDATEEYMNERKTKNMNNDILSRNQEYKKGNNRNFKY